MITSFFKDKKGSTALVVALMLPILVGACAYAVDLSYFYLLRGKLQTAADAAALAAVHSLSNPATVFQTAIDIAQKNVLPEYGVVTTQADVEIGGYDPATKRFSVGSAIKNAVRVTAIRNQDHKNAPIRFFSSLFGQEAIEIKASAIAVFSPVKACVIALDPSAGSSFKVAGNGTVSVPNCRIYVNSSNDSALTSQGSASVNAQGISVVGGYSGNFFPTPDSRQPPIADPLANLPEPTVPSSCSISNTTIGTTDVTLSGNQRYCGNIKISGNATVTFGPGIHYFTGGTLTIGQNVNLVSNEAVLFFAKDAYLDSASNQTVHLTSPQSGIYRGIAIFQSRQGNTPLTFKLTGGKDYFVDGTIYLPKSNLALYGNVDLNVTSKSGYVIANQFFYQGDSKFTFDAFGGAVAPGFSPHAVLVQ